MRRAAAALLAGLAVLWPAAGRAQAGPDAPAGSPLPEAGACGAQAARYDDGRGFALVVTRAGQARAENPLRPLTPEITQVLQVVIGGKLATAYGPDFTALRRGGAPGAVEAMLGAPVRWEASLPVLPDPIAIVGEDGAPLARLGFRGCEAPPAVKAAPQAERRGKPPRAAGRRPEAPGEPPAAPEAGDAAQAPKPARPRAGRAPTGGGAKVPPGFTLPQGAVPE